MPFIFNPFTNNLDATDITVIPPGTVATLSGNSGGAVPPAGGNINIVGDGVSANVVGNPGTNTLTISAMLPAGFIATVTADTGGPVGPTADNLNIVGDGTTIAIAGNPGTSTLTVSTIPQPLPLTWSIITTDQTAVAGNAYFVNVGAGTVSVSLPPAGVLGDTIVIAKASFTGTMQFLVGAGQAITFGNLQSFGPIGTVSTTELGASITLVYFTTNSWYVYTAVGNFILT